jgi:hypothetical protein
VSREVVGHVIQQLLTDESLRVRFAVDPDETIAELLCRGFDLSAEEIEVFARTDARVWFWSPDLVGHRLH